MRRLLDEDDVIDALNSITTITGRGNAKLAASPIVALMVGMFEDMIKALPSAEPEILACGEGELNVPDWDEMIVICDCCGHAIHVKRQEVGNDSETD